MLYRLSPCLLDLVLQSARAMVEIVRAAQNSVYWSAVSVLTCSSRVPISSRLSSRSCCSLSFSRCNCVSNVRCQAVYHRLDHGH